MTQSDLIAFDTEDNSKDFSDANQDHPGYEKFCTQIAAIDALTGERFHYRPHPQAQTDQRTLPRERLGRGALPRMA